jgi:hypothetical protein
LDELKCQICARRYKSTKRPPKHVQLRIFGGCLAQKVYEEGWEVKTEQQLIRRIKIKMKEFYKHFVENLLEGVKAKVKSIGDNGV